MWSSIAWHSPEGSWLEALESTLEGEKTTNSWQTTQSWLQNSSGIYIKISS